MPSHPPRFKAWYLQFGFVAPIILYGVPLQSFCQKKNDAQPSMMHVRFNEAWHGKMHKQPYKLSGAQYAMELHIEENTT